jgi:hypothetical protein
MDSSKTTHKPDEHRDPLTGEHGAHPVCVGVGTAVGGAAGGAAVGAAAVATGAALGSALGPVGTAVGVVAGGIAGALVGREVAEAVHPTIEEAEAVPEEEIPAGVTDEDFRTAYRYGCEARPHHEGQRFEDVEADLRRGWEQSGCRLGWDQARQAVRDGWDRPDQPHAPAPAEKSPAEERRPL